MQAIFVALGYGLLALVGVSVLVALLEYLRSERRPWPGAAARAGRAVSVDLDIDALAAAAPTEQQQRQVTVDQAMARMTQASAESDLRSAESAATAWIETRPTVLSDRRAHETAP